MQFLFWWVMKKKLCWLSVFLNPHLCGWIKPRPWAWWSTLLLLSYTQLVLLYLSPAPVCSQLVDIWPHGTTDTFCRSSVIWSVLTPNFSETGSYSVAQNSLNLWVLGLQAWIWLCFTFFSEQGKACPKPSLDLMLPGAVATFVLHSTPFPSNLSLCLRCLWANFYFTFIFDVTFIGNILYLLKRKIFTTRVMMFIGKKSHLCIFKHIFVEIYIHRYTWV